MWVHREIFNFQFSICNRYDWRACTLISGHGNEEGRASAPVVTLTFRKRPE